MRAHVRERKMRGMEFMYEHTDIPAGLTLRIGGVRGPAGNGGRSLASLRSSLSPRRYSPVGGSYFARSSTSR